jgi:flagellar biosynthetic protein FliO
MRHNNTLSFRKKYPFTMRIIFIFFMALLFCSAPLADSFYLYGENEQQQAGKSSDSKGDITQGKAEEAERVPGQGFEEEDFRPKVEEESYGWLMMKTIFVLGLLAVGFYMFLRFIQQKSGIQLTGQNVIQVLSATPLGPGKTLHVVDMAGKVFLLGVSENNINLLTEIKEREEIDRIRLLSSRSTPLYGKGFQEIVMEQVGKAVTFINQKRDKKGKVYSMEEMSEDELDVTYLNNQKNRLKKMNGNHED